MIDIREQLAVELRHSKRALLLDHPIGDVGVIALVVRTVRHMCHATGKSTSRAAVHAICFIAGMQFERFVV